jgi:hypothetical protein
VIWFGDLVTGTPAKCLPKTALIFTFENPILQKCHWHQSRAATMIRIKVHLQVADQLLGRVDPHVRNGAHDSPSPAITGRPRGSRPALTR